jgi:two-component system sensor histidine kinase/response regulator
VTQVRPSVLLVDDVEANLVALDALLDDMGCDLVRANGGNEALRQLLRREFAVMLLDVQMPGMDGYEVAKYARENPGTRDVPIIFLTAMHYTEDSVLRGYGSGAVDFLLKPINATVLRAKVRVFLDLYLGKRRLADEIVAHTKTLGALEQANTALRHFTNAASHDLKAPLRAVRGFLEFIAEQAGDQLDERARDYLDRCRKANRRMESLLNALLVYAGLQKPVSYTEVDCSRLLEHVKADLSEELNRAGVVSLSAEPLPTVIGDVDRLYQLLLNLVSNALKFRRPEEPLSIRVTARQANDEVTFCVEDNGIGIAAENLVSIFDPFERVHSESKYEGSGLGLSICKQIVEQHNGRIWVESKVGHGSRFYFVLAQRSSPE